GGHVHARGVPLRDLPRRALEPEDPAREHPALLGADRRAAPAAGGRSGDRGGVPLVALAAVPGRRDPDPDPRGAGRRRPTREPGRERADRGGHAGEGHRPRVPGLRRRGARARQAREPAALRRGERALSRQAPGWSLRAL
ncbi:MAG: hypothetical protein AVDCRST_MAG53-3073, partial [uncultured Solirubrobacteraceae bacterium]